MFIFGGNFVIDGPNPNSQTKDGTGQDQRLLHFNFFFHLHIIQMFQLLVGCNKANLQQFS